MRECDNKTCRIIRENDVRMRRNDNEKATENDKEKKRREKGLGRRESCGAIKESCVPSSFGSHEYFIFGPFECLHADALQPLHGRLHRRLTYIEYCQMIIK
jgi:hypothetical protein